MENNDIPEINRYIKRTMDYYGIQGKELSEKSGISRNHISEFRNGKSALSTDLLCKVLLVMDEIAPGSRAYFCQLLAGKTPMRQSANQSKSLEDLVDVATDDEIYRIILKIGDRWNRSNGSRNTDSEKSLLKV